MVTHHISRLAAAAHCDLGLHVPGGAVRADPADEVVDALRVGHEAEGSLGRRGVGDAGAVLVVGLGDLQDVVPGVPVKYESLTWSHTLLLRLRLEGPLESLGP